MTTFGTIDQHHYFIIRTDPHEARAVELVECWPNEERVIGTLMRDIWERIRSVVANDWNNRRQRNRQRLGRWGADETHVPVVFGKEVAVLFIGLRTAHEDVLGRAMARWAGLAPEERWWLATQALADPRARNWHKAIQAMLTEE